jgi:hypothetical protein
MNVKGMHLAAKERKRQEFNVSIQIACLNAEIGLGKARRYYLASTAAPSDQLEQLGAKLADLDAQLEALEARLAEIRRS